MYAGRIARDREIETLIAAAEQVPDLDVTVVGPSDPYYLAALQPGRVRISGPLDVPGVDRLLRSAGIAAVTHSDRWLNHRLAMPNKLFHAVRAGVPVVATDVGELGRIVRTYGLGVLYRPGDAASMVAAIHDVHARYSEFVDAVAAAGDELSWEEDARRLNDVYTTIEAGGTV